MRCNFVRNINDRYLGMNGQNNGLQCSDIMVFKAEIRQQSNERWGFPGPPYELLLHKFLSVVCKRYWMVTAFPLFADL